MVTSMKQLRSVPSDLLHYSVVSTDFAKILISNFSLVNNVPISSMHCCKHKLNVHGRFFTLTSFDDGRKVLRLAPPS